MRSKKTSGRVNTRCGRGQSRHPPSNSNFNDGKCNIFDAIDLDGNPVKVNERKENMCERVCEEKMVGGQGQRGKSKDRIVGDLVDAVSTARGAMRSLSAQRARVSELGLILADDPSCRRCVVKQLFRYALGRPEAEADGPSIDRAVERFETSRFRFEELIISIATSDSFLGGPS